MAYPASEAHLRSWLDAGLAAHQQGDFDRALAAYRQILSLAPDHTGALNLLGTALLQLGRPDEAVGHLERAARRQRDNPNLLANLAQAYLALGRHADAGVTFRKASRLVPGEVQFHVGVAAALALEGKLSEAEAMLQRHTVRFPEAPLVWLNLGNALRDLKRPHDAMAAYRKALELEPQHLEARNSLGSALHSLLRFAEAEEQYRACLRNDPQFSIARFNLASVVIDVGRFGEAEAICRELVASEPQVPEGHTFLGAAVGHQGRLFEALACHEQAARLAPDSARNSAVYGACLMEVGRAPEGQRWLADAVDRSPGSDAPRQFLAPALLAHGCLQDGWAEYTCRPAAVRFREKYPQIEIPWSLPADVEGKSVCVLREQGLGDEIFFLRYVPVLAARGARVTYRATRKIASLLSRVASIREVVDETSSIPAADAYILVGDLPLALGDAASSRLPPAQHARSAAVSDFPQHIRVYWPPVPESISIEPREDKLAEVRERLAAAGPPPYVGLTWRAGTPPEEQNAVTWMLYKAISTPSLADAVKGTAGTFLALQRKPAPGEIDALARSLGRPVHDFSSYNEDLEGMLALLAVIDEYIGVSNTNVHLRAAAGKNARVLVPVPAEWRWMQSGGYTPWFPGFSIYRQSLQGDWAGALKALARDLVVNYSPADRSNTP